MALTPSKMVPLGTNLTAFRLLDVVGKQQFSDCDLRKGGQVSLIMFICNHCPYVQHIIPEITRIYRDYSEKPLQIIAINSNDTVSYPMDGPDHMEQLARMQGWKFPFLLDEEQTVAREFGATCTPDFFLFNAQMQLVYRGRLDDSRPDNQIKLSGKDLRLAIDQSLAGEKVFTDQIPSMGCNIKWKS